MGEACACNQMRSRMPICSPVVVRKHAHREFIDANLASFTKECATLSDNVLDSLNKTCT